MRAYVIFFLFISFYCRSQIHHKVSDSQSKKPIPYVSVFHNDSLIGLTDKDGKIHLKENYYLYKKDGYREKVTNLSNIWLEKTEGEILEEITISVPSKKIIKNIGNKEAFTILLKGVEFISFIEPNKKEVGKRIYKISYPLEKRNKYTENDTSIFQISIYDSEKQKIYSEYIDDIEENLVLIPNTEIILPKSGLYIGVEYLGKTEETKNIYDYYFSYDLFFKKNTYYKRNYLNKNQWETIEEINDNEYFSQIYKSMIEPVFNRFKNITPLFQIELY